MLGIEPRELRVGALPIIGARQARDRQGPVARDGSVTYSAT
jgi:hypothetical protein